MNDPITAAWIAASVSVAATVWNTFQLRPIIKFQTKADAKKIIHKCQFEKEFTIYTELWKQLIDLKDAAYVLRPIAEIVDPSKTEQERRLTKMTYFNDCFFNLAVTFEHNRPFYSKDIHKEISTLLDTSRSEQVDYVHLSEEKDRDYWENGKKNMQAIVVAMDAIENLIRNRIEVIEVG